MCVCILFYENVGLSSLIALFFCSPRALLHHAHRRCRSVSADPLAQPPRHAGDDSGWTECTITQCARIQKETDTSFKRYFLEPHHRHRIRGTSSFVDPHRVIAVAVSSGNLFPFFLNIVFAKNSQQCFCIIITINSW